MYKSTLKLVITKQEVSYQQLCKRQYFLAFEWHLIQVLDRAIGG